MASAVLCARLRSTTSNPALAATSAMPEPMIPEPTIPTRLMPIVPPAVTCEKAKGYRRVGRSGQVGAERTANCGASGQNDAVITEDDSPGYISAPFRSRRFVS